MAMNIPDIYQKQCERRRTGILGGSFNPVHTGHLLMARDALEFFELERVLFMPCAIPPHKHTAGLELARHRLAMLNLAIAPESRFGICRTELDRGGISYSIDTVEAFRRDHPDDDLFFIIGDDSLIDLPNWRRIDDLLALCEFITLARPGVKLPPGAPAIISGEARERLLSRRRVGHGINVSSTEIRSRVSARLPIRYLVPEAVEEYIVGNGLYLNESSRPAKEEE